MTRRPCCRWLWVFTAFAGCSVLVPDGAGAAIPRFTVHPPGDEDAFVSSIYKAVLVTAGCPKPEVIVDAPAGARYEDEVLKYLPPGGVGESFEVVVRAVNEEGEAALRWRVTLRSPVMTEFDAASDFTSLFFDPEIDTPASNRELIDATANEGELRISLPGAGDDNFDSWCGFDRTPRWWSRTRVFGAFELRTRVRFIRPPSPPDSGYHVGLVVDRGHEDLSILGLIRDRVELERTCRRDGDFTAFSPITGAAEDSLSLRVVVDGKRQEFYARRLDTDPWLTVFSRDDIRPPIAGVGFATKNWADQGPLMVGFDYFHYRGLPAGAPVLDTPEHDYAFSGSEYSVSLASSSDLEPTIQIISPADAWIDPSGFLRHAVTGGEGSSFDVRLRATTTAGEVTRSWRVDVVDPVRYEFTDIAEFTGNFVEQESESTRQHEVTVDVADGHLVIALPETGREDFDSWCGFDRTPRWLHDRPVMGTYAAETVMSFRSLPADLLEGYHAGLAVDRGIQDLAILGAIRNGVEYERTCSRGCENTDTLFGGLWDPPGARVALRMESDGADRRVLARRDGDPDWTVVARLGATRPRARGIGLAAKNWGTQGPFAVEFDFFEYGPPGCEMVEAPEDEEVLQGALYTALVRARGVNPVYRVVEPPDASVDPRSGEASWPVPEAMPPGSTVRFEVEASCGLATDAASWNLTVASLEPPLDITSFAPAEVSYLGKTAFRIRGANFTAQTDVVIDATQLEPVFADSSELRGTVPPHAPGRVDVGVVDPARGRAVLPGALRYVGPLAVSAIEPSRSRAGDNPSVTVSGVGFTPETVVTVGERELAEAAFIDAHALRGRLPDLPPGTYQVTASDRDALGNVLVASLGDAFTSLPAVQVTAISPAEVSYLGKTPCEVSGANFTPATRVLFDIAPVVTEFIAPSSLRVTAPPHEVTAKPIAVTVEDPDTGRAVLPSALSYIGPFRITNIEPATVKEGDLVPLTVSGAGFTPETTVAIGGRPLEDTVFEDARRLRGRAPALPPGAYDVVASDRDASERPVVFTLPDAFAVTRESAPAIASVEPPYLSSRLATPIRLHGENFTRSMRVVFDRPGDGRAPVEVPYEFVSSELLLASAPPYPDGDVDAVSLVGGEEVGRLPDAARYVSPWVPAPDEIEVTLREGRIPLIRWRNPVTYRDIRIYRNGQLLTALPGDATGFADEIPIAEESASYKLVATMHSAAVSMVDFVAGIPFCDPPADHGTADRGPKDFPIPGGHAPFQSGDGVGADIEPEFIAFDPKIVIVDEDSGNPVFHPMVVGEVDPSLLVFPTQFVTGFTLFKEAKKLRFELHAAKLAAEPGLTLRALIASATAGVERQAELVLPAPDIHPAHGWIELTYNTELPNPLFRTASIPPHPGDPSKDAPFPAADYRVTVYAVGGEVSKQYFSISSDASPEQIPVPGVGCPPYMLLRVTDTTGRNSAPIILDVEQDPGSETAAFFGGAGVWATLLATAEDPDGDPITKYEWKIRQGSSVIGVKFTSAPKQLFAFPDFGYYDVALTVSDNRCGESAREFVVIIHPPAICVPENDGPNFTFPSPRPDHLHHVPDLDGGMDFAPPIAETFRIFVVDACGGGGPLPPLTKRVQVALQDPNAGSTTPILGVNGQPIAVDAEPVSPVDEDSPIRFWTATFPHMGRVPELPGEPGVHPPRFRLGLIARASKFEDAAVWLEWRPVESYTPTKVVVPSRRFVNFYPKPAYLDVAPLYSGYSYDRKSRSYSFFCNMSAPGGLGHDFGFTPSVSLPTGTFPALKNRVDNVSQNVQLHMSWGEWALDAVEIGLDAVALSTKFSGRKRVYETLGDGQGSALQAADAFSYEHCRRETLFSHSFESTIFEGVIWEGFLPPPVWVRFKGSVHLGVALGVETYTRLELGGFDEDPYRAAFALCPEAAIGVGGVFGTDIFYGVASVDLGFTASTVFRMPFQVEMDQSGILGGGPRYGLQVGLDVDGFVEGCLAWGLVCRKESFDIVPPPGSNETMLSLASVGEPGLGCPSCAGAAAGIPGEGAGILLSGLDHQLDIATSPSGMFQVAVGIFQLQKNPPTPPVVAFFVRTVGSGWQWPPQVIAQLGASSVARDPKVVFLDEPPQPGPPPTLLVAWTQSYYHLEPGLGELEPESAELFNTVMRRDEIVYSTGFGFGWSPPLSLSDDQTPADYRADGKVTLAKIPGEDAVWAAWVRYETADMLASDPIQGLEVNMKATSIYARKIAGGLPSGDKVLISGNNNAIDVEPDIAVSPTGTLYLVWVNDALHEDLITSNKGRNLLFSVNSGGGWSAPAPVIDDVSAIPAILDPSIAVKETGYGMVSFTALPANAAEEDTGVGNTRLLYTVKLLGGVWQNPPTLVFKACETPVFAKIGQLISTDKTVPANQGLGKIPDFTLLIEEIGALGTRGGAGNILVTQLSAGTGAWSRPVNLTDDDRSHYGAAATITPGGELVLVHQSPGPALLSPLPGAGAGGAGGGAPGAALLDDLMVQDIPLVADPAIVSCRVSDPYGLPGQAISATVEVENRGLAGTPAGPEGESLLSLTGVLLDPESGRSEQVFTAPLPALLPGERAAVTEDLAVPDTPRVLRLELGPPIAGERNPEDNVRQCDLGARPPQRLTSSLAGQREDRRVVLRWRNPSAYDGILVYRDGSLLAELPGNRTIYVDRPEGITEPDGAPEWLEYAVRGRVRRSLSVRTLTRADVPPTPAHPLFRRGEVTADGDLNISDPIRLFDFLFLGGVDPPCMDAADADDDGSVNITDGIYTLSFLFLGGPPTPAPGPSTCGVDVREDDLDCSSYPPCDND